MSDAAAREIDRLLAERRPDRYEMSGGDEWLDSIADEVASLIPAAEARARLATNMVRSRELTKTKATNRLLREIHQSGQLPLDWIATLSLPIIVGKERVALRAATAADFRLFATDERRKAAADFAARNASCEAAEWLADSMETNGWRFGKDISL